MWTKAYEYGIDLIGWHVVAVSAAILLATVLS